MHNLLQRFLPVAPAHDLFFIKPPEIIVPVLPRFRPYEPEDEVNVLSLTVIVAIIEHLVFDSSVNLNYIRFAA